jgi:hypothetical protein
MPGFLCRHSRQKPQAGSASNDSCTDTLPSSASTNGIG